jgi:hypothetical protein
VSVQQFALAISGRREARKSPIEPPKIELRQAVEVLAEEYPGQGGNFLDWAQRREKLPDLRN